ncbi:PAS domain S-box [Thermanaerovibrio velox DSM 12556]|uniref:histidine kinase n=1 Tax=Thermanaerovibrio velox DSM 12556 TaxID=926567 RepID=H0UR71_9BACT|nr:PAS domain-containing hybrid sensor histidine kinase/response regulator [Thermanaerovibrio velox]EHM10908.1 PAS domain S-box [Thermanaerovibrio velox DSM 12556]
MTIDKRRLSHFKARAAAAVAVYLLGALVFARWTYVQNVKTQMTQVDKQMLIAANALKHMLTEDFHDRAVGRDSISLEEEMLYRRRFNRFAQEGGFIYVYTLAEKDGKFYFSAPTVTEEEAKERKRWYFHPYEDIPKEFMEAFRSGKPAFVTYHDQWGSFRSVAVPEVSPGGRRYLACVDYDITGLLAMARREALKALAEALYFSLLFLPALWAILSLLKGMREEMDHIESMKERLRMAVESTDLAIWDIDLRSGRWTVNDQYRRIFGYDLDDIPNWLDTVHPEDRERVFRTWEDHLNGLTEKYECEFRKRSAFSDYLWVMDHGKVFERDDKGRPLRAVGAVKDVTPRRLAEQMLRSAKEQAEAEAKSRSRLVSRVSHEIRTPLNSILGYADLLKGRAQALGLSPEVMEWVDTIYRSGYHLLSVVEEILDMSAVEAGKLKVNSEAFDLRDLLSDVERMMSLGASKKGLDLRVRTLRSLPERISADRGKLRQVMINLLGNAVKFTSEGEVVMEVWMESILDKGYSKAGTLCVRVKDTGPGVAPAIRDSLFQPFEKYGSQGGAGLGLAISYSFAAAMGGSLSLEDSPKGASFLLKVPVDILDHSSIPQEVDVTEPELTEEERARLMDALKSGDRDEIQRAVQGVGNEATRNLLMGFFASYDHASMMEIAEGSGGD